MPWSALWHVDITKSLFDYKYIVVAKKYEWCAVCDYIGYCWVLGAVSIRKTVLLGMAIPMLKIRRPNGRLIINMEIAIRR